MSQSRTKNSVRNSSVAMCTYFANLILQFYSRKIFLQYLGTEILGLNTTATNLLQFLNLAELGVWSAIAVSLYKPLADNDYERINQLINFNGLIYRRIAITIIGASIILMCFFPLIFKDMKLPLWYAYASFGVLLFSSLLGYFVNYRQFLLTADQKNYKVHFTLKLSALVKTLFQIGAMILFTQPYLWWLGLEVLFTIIGSCALNVVIKRTYPFLHPINQSFTNLKKAFPDVITKIRQLFVQKISGFILFQTSPIILYGIANLSMVALYGNYMLIINGLISLMAALFDGMLASIGNLVSSSTIKRSLEVFEELFSLRFYIISILSFGVWVLGQEFVSWWIGSEYLLPKSTLALLIAIFAVYVNRYIVYDYLSAYGYFGDVWASVIEVILNIGLSVSLGLLWGLNGILLGVLISLCALSLVWKPIYLFKIKLKTGYLKCIKIQLYHYIVGIILFLLISPISNIIKHDFNSPIIAGGVSTVVFALTFGGLLFLTVAPFRCSLKRLYSVVACKR
ncbi:MAG: sugar transporter [Muribaculaceae bacterium]|nr:sugar transporter [Muribaculaceae bacterium]